MRHLRPAHVAAVAGALVVIGDVLWVDVTTSLWQDYVVISGLAAGLVTFLLTWLVLDRLVVRERERRWAPLNRLALTEFMHALADEGRSEISLGHVVMRSLPAVTDGDAVPAELTRLRDSVVHERKALARAVSTWAEFLTASGDNDEVLNHAADIALRLDAVRDAAVAVERGEAAVEDLAREVAACNRHFAAMEAELRRRLTL